MSAYPSCEQIFIAFTYINMKTLESSITEPKVNVLF